jgi:hypothetical protein
LAPQVAGNRAADDKVAFLAGGLKLDIILKSAPEPASRPRGTKFDASLPEIA